VMFQTVCSSWWDFCWHRLSRCPSCSYVAIEHWQ